MQRPFDVLDLVIAAVDEIDAHTAAHMLVKGIRNRHPTRIGKPLYAGRDIDAVPIKVAAVDHDIAEIDANAQHNASICRLFVIGDGHGLLHFGRAFDGADGTAELDQQAVADPLEDAALMAGDKRLHHLVPPHLQFRQRACFVQLHEPAVANHVSGQNGDEPALDGLVGHGHVRFRECTNQIAVARHAFKSNSPRGVRSVRPLKRLAAGSLARKRPERVIARELVDGGPVDPARFELR